MNDHPPSPYKAILETTSLSGDHGGRTLVGIVTQMGHKFLLSCGPCDCQAVSLYNGMESVSCGHSIKKCICCTQFKLLVG